MVGGVYDPRMARTLRESLRDLRRRLRTGENDAFSVQRELVQRAAPIILDVGAHRGKVARTYRRLFPDATLHCFEPFPDSFATLSAAMRGDARAHCHQLAIARSAGTATLQANGVSATNSLLETDARAGAYWGAGVLDTAARLQVRTVSLDEFAADNGIQAVDILKLDVQGGEYDALLGCTSLLSRHAVSLVYAEVITCPTYAGQRSLHDYFALFNSVGYEFLDFYAPVRRNNELLQADLIFLAPQFNAARKARIAATVATPA